MYESGVIDSYKVIKSVIEEATNLATMIMMIECSVVKMKNYTPMPLAEHHQYREVF